MRNRRIPPEAEQYAAAFEDYLRARPEGAREQEASDRMTATLTVLADGRLSREPVRSAFRKAKP